jgi:hypothetical protein
MGNGFPIMASNIPPPPPGFQIVGSGNNIPPLPDGFVLDQASLPGDPNRWGVGSEATDFVTMGASTKLPAAGLGLMDAASGFIKGDGWNYSDNYNKELSRIRADQEAWQNQNPGNNVAAKGAGIAIGIGSLPAIGRGLLGATATGGAYGVGGGLLQDANSIQERAANAARGGAEGAALGSLGYGLVKSAGGLLSRIFGKAEIPTATTEDLRQAKNLAYAAAENGPGRATVDTKQFGDLIRNINVNVGSKTNKGGVLGTVTNKPYSGTNGTIAELNKIGQEVVTGKSPPPSITELEQLRQALNAQMNDGILPNGKLTADATMTGDIIDEIDGILLNSPYKEARAAYRRYVQSTTLDRAFYLAENAAGSNYTQAGMEKAIQNEFKKLANSKNFTKAFDADQQKAILEVVRVGGFHNFLKKFGALAPKGGLSTMWTIAATMHNPVAGLGIGVGSSLSKAASTRMTLDKARNVDRMVKQGGLLGGVAPANLPPNPRMPGIVNGMGANTPAAMYLLGNQMLDGQSKYVNPSR